MEDVHASLSCFNGRLLRLLAKYSNQHYTGLQMAAHGQRTVLTTASRRRIRQVAIAGQVLRHFTAPWAEQFLSDVETQLQQAYPGRAEFVSSVFAPRFASKLGRRATEFTFSSQAPVFTPGAAPPLPTISVPELLRNSQTMYDVQLSYYNALVEDMNNTIAMLKGKLDQLPSSSASAAAGQASVVIQERAGSADEEAVGPPSASSSASGSSSSEEEGSSPLEAELVDVKSFVDDHLNDLGQKARDYTERVVREGFESFAKVLPNMVSTLVESSISSTVAKSLEPQLEQLAISVADKFAALATRLASLETLSTPSPMARGRSSAGRDEKEVSRGRSPSSVEPLRLCKYGSQCYRKDCVFRHPEGHQVRMDADLKPSLDTTSAASSSRPQGVVREVPSATPTAASQPQRIEAVATPIDYSKFNFIANMLQVEEMHGQMHADLLADSDSEVPEPDVD